MPPVRPIDKGESKGMAQARRKEGAFRAPITRVFVQQHRSGESPDTLRSTAGKRVSVESPERSSSRVPFMRVVAGRIRDAYPAAETIGEEPPRSERGLHQVL